MPEIVPYASLEQARAEIKQAANQSVGGDDDAYVLRALYFVSGRIEKLKGMSFAPYIDQWYLDALGEHIDDLYHSLTLNEPMLSISAVEVGGVEWTADTDYLPVPRNRTPIQAIRIPPGSGKDWSNYGNDWIDAVLIAGVGGYHTRYSSAFYASGDTVQDAPLTAGASTITVQAVDGVDAFNRAPRFSPGQLLRIGTGNDFRLILDVDKSNKTLTVLPSARGSTSTSQAAGTAIYIFQPEEAIQRAALRWASYLYKRRGSFSGSEVDALTGNVLTNFPQDAPQEVSNILDEITPFNLIRGVG